jgi:short-subunit dehydrogenase
VNLSFWNGINCTRAVVDHVIERKYGKIVGISSEAGRWGGPGYAVYSGTKGVVNGLSKALASEVRHCNTNVNAVCLG